jgi:hypothetical protein
MRDALRKIGSLKVAVVLLTGLAAAMAVASIYESQHGTEAALRVFYGSRWFAGLMAAVGVNVLAALLVRWPPTRSKTGFVIAHVSVLIILLGALITRQWAVHGSLWLATGQSRTDFDTEAWSIVMIARGGQERLEIPLGPDGPLVGSAGPDQRLGGVTLTVERFAADTQDDGEQIVADPNGTQPAAKVRFVHDQQEHVVWILGEQVERIGGLHVRLLRVTNPAMLSQLLQPTSRPAGSGRGTVVIQIGGQPYEVNVNESLGKTVPLGPSGYKVSVRRYLPHAQVVGREIRSASSRPVNPMVEFDLIGPAGESELHRLFARFPEQDFSTMHRAQSGPTTSPASTPAFKFRYVGAAQLSGPTDFIDLLLDADGKLHVRFADAEGQVTSVAASTGNPVATPWKGTQLTVLEVLPKARSERAIEPIPPRKQNPIPAAFVCLTAPDAAQPSRMWLRRGETSAVQVGDRPYEIGYIPVRVPMGFTVKLLAPVITHYPGTRQPRTYQSRVLVEDPAKGVNMGRTISMNAPLKYGGYTFYQSSYQFDRKGDPTASMLSVARDRGEAVVYVGYFGLMLGLVVALIQRLRRRTEENVETSKNREVETP